MNKNIPNMLTLLRFVFIPFIILSLYYNNFILAFILLTISSLTDILDGFIARKCNLVTDFGKLMDPLADKATQLTILITLALKHTIPFWILCIIALKEFVMIAGASFLYGKDMVVSSKWYGKLTTVVFYCAIVSSLIIGHYNLTSRFDTYLYYSGIVLTLFSLLMYFKSFYAQGYLKNLNKPRN
ncbi:MAG: CDP-diacylglycerol--glycerol-3-phosphate 3-phosphatidyltransferase [Clostridia bacterium]|nr:CDP-diacylglycerol--glycerol-3-phosphate 3-phosphatidyltransferase [Clostridia bacterium]